MTAISFDCEALKPSQLRYRSECGFCLAELLIAAMILIPVSLAVFHMLDSAQRAALYQSEVHTVLDSTRSAMDTITRILRQSGNDPAGLGIDGVTIISRSAIRVRADLTGSLGPGNPDKGDPDGDTNDSGEDVVIRYNPDTQSIELVPAGGFAQTIASNISSLSILCLDEAGSIADAGSAAREVWIEVTGAGSVPEPSTGRLFRLPLTGRVLLASRG